MEKLGYTPITIKFADPLYDMQNYCYERIRKEVPYPKDRKLLQWLGTEWGRSIDKDIWVNIWKLDCKNTIFFNDRAIVLCDDVRFNNEAEAVRLQDGVIINVEASDTARSRRGELINTTHVSEAGIDKSYITSNIYNEGSLFDLEQQVGYIIDNILGYDEV